MAGETQPLSAGLLPGRALRCLPALPEYPGAAHLLKGEVEWAGASLEKNTCQRRLGSMPQSQPPPSSLHGSGPQRGTSWAPSPKVKGQALEGRRILCDHTVRGSAEAWLRAKGKDPGNRSAGDVGAGCRLPDRPGAVRAGWARSAPASPGRVWPAIGVGIQTGRASRPDDHNLGSSQTQRAARRSDGY